MKLKPGCLARLAIAPALIVIPIFVILAATGGCAPLTPVSGHPPAPDFTLPDTDGNPVRLSDLRGKVVLLNFWATWCPPCREEMPSMQALWLDLRDEDFIILAVNVGEEDDAVFAFANEFPTPLSFPILMDKKSAVLNDYPIIGLPTSFIIDKDGNMAFQTVGGREWDHPEVRETLRALMQR